MSPYSPSQRMPRLLSAYPYDALWSPSLCPGSRARRRQRRQRRQRRSPGTSLGWLFATDESSVGQKSNIWKIHENKQNIYIYIYLYLYIVNDHIYPYITLASIRWDLLQPVENQVIFRWFWWDMVGNLPRCKDMWRRKIITYHEVCSTVPFFKAKPCTSIVL